MTGSTVALSSLLMEYWRKQLTCSVSARRHAFNVTRSMVRARDSCGETLVPFVLGETDEEIVFHATIAYLEAFRASGAGARNATEWVRRRLALNCAAVFAALLVSGEDQVLEGLLPLRSRLDTEEFSAIRRRLEADCPAAARSFLLAWAELLPTPPATRPVAQQRAPVRASASW
jgi:hypothetical protein